MLFKKISFFSFLILSLFSSYSAESFPPEEETTPLPSRIVSFGKTAVQAEYIQDFLEVATGLLQRDGPFVRLMEGSFPETRNPQGLKRDLESTFESVHAKSDPCKRLFDTLFNSLESDLTSTQQSSSLAIAFLGGASAHQISQIAGQDPTDPETLTQALSLSSSAPSDHRRDPFDMGQEDYRYFQIGYGLIKFILNCQEDTHDVSGAKIGHQDILEGLKGIYDLIKGNYPRVISYTSTPEALDPSFYLRNIPSLSRVYMVFALESEDIDIRKCYEGAGAWTSILVLTQEWTAERKNHYFYHTFSNLIEERIARYTQLSSTQLSTIESMEGGKEDYRKRVGALIDDYTHNYLFAYMGETFFSKSQRTYANGVTDARYMLNKVPALYASLVHALYPEQSQEERDIRVSNSLKESRCYPHLKASFLEDNATPNFSHWNWGEIIFEQVFMERIRIDHPELFFEEDTE